VHDDLLDWLAFRPNTPTVHLELEREGGTHTLLSLYVRRTDRSGWSHYPLVFSDADGHDVAAIVEQQVRQHHADAPPEPPPLRTSREW
jgi:hypothetical protein